MALAEHKRELAKALRQRASENLFQATHNSSLRGIEVFTEIAARHTADADRLEREASS